MPIDYCLDPHQPVKATPPNDHIAWIGEYKDMGFSEIYLHNRGRNQLEFVRFFGEHVLPKLR
ncbi:hypothetical protein LJR030_003664 [Rhizobium sp. LjRoot30]|uniref:hypothetical protein n=1 Tax=Rhizobium sp. LjRoot30 TaxID=3342320 RepID=UPI003ECC39CB